MTGLKTFLIAIVINYEKTKAYWFKSLVENKEINESVWYWKVPVEHATFVDLDSLKGVVMEKVNVKMKIENICLRESCWKDIDMIMAGAGKGMSRDIFLGSLINSGLNAMNKDIKDIMMINGMSLEDIYYTNPGDVGVKDSDVQRINNPVHNEDGIDQCYNKAV